MKTPALIPVLYCVDVEPDLRDFHVRKPSAWAGFKYLYDYLNKQRPRLEEKTGAPVHFCWYLRMDEQIRLAYGDAAWAVLSHPGEIKGMLENGDEIGLHSHGYRWDEGREKWIADHGNQAWIDECVEIGFEAFERSLGFKPASFRFGNQWINTATLRKAEALGAKYDLTVEPGREGDGYDYGGDILTGELPDFRGVPSHPYRPSAADFRKEDKTREAGLWEIPLTTAEIPYALGRLETLKRSIFKPGTLTKKLTMNLAIGPRNFQQMTEHALLRPKPHLGMVMRSDLPISPSQRKNLEAHMEYLSAPPESRRLRFCRPDELIAFYK